MKSYKTNRTDLVCTKCGNIATIQRKNGSARKVGHVKDLYCYVCKEITKHYEVKDIDLFLNNHNLPEEKIVQLVRRKKSD